jgi:hypothetical protein
MLPSPRYEGVTLKGKRLGLNFDLASCTLSYRGDVQSEFGPGNQDSLILAFFLKQTLSRFRDLYAFNSVERINVPNRTELTKTELALLEHNTAYMYLPAKRIDSGIKDCPNILMFIEQIQIGTNLFASPEGFGSTSYNRRLDCKAYVAIWDNEKGEIVSYGISTASVHIPIFVKMNHWEALIDEFVINAMANSPFPKR